MNERVVFRIQRAYQVKRAFAWIQLSVPGQIEGTWPKHETLHTSAIRWIIKTCLSLPFDIRMNGLGSSLSLFPGKTWTHMYFLELYAIFESLCGKKLKIKTLFKIVGKLQSFISWHFFCSCMPLKKLSNHLIKKLKFYLSFFIHFPKKYTQIDGLH